MSLIFDSLTVGELKEKLSEFSDDMLVVNNVNYGDRARTQQAVMVDEVDFAAIVRTSYSSTGFKVIDTMDESDYEPDEVQRVVTLNYGDV